MNITIKSISNIDKVFKKDKQNEDDDIISTSNELSLQCPVSTKKEINHTFIL